MGKKEFVYCELMTLSNYSAIKWGIETDHIKAA